MCKDISHFLFFSYWIRFIFIRKLMTCKQLTIQAFQCRNHISTLNQIRFLQILNQLQMVIAFYIQAQRHCCQKGRRNAFINTDFISKMAKEQHFVIILAKMNAMEIFEQIYKVICNDQYSELMLALSEKQLSHALFYSLKKNDIDHAQYLLQLDAPVNTSFFIDQDKIVYTANLLVGKVAECIKQKGLSHAKSQQWIRVLDFFLQKKCDLRCHCTVKNPHYCALSEAFQFINFESQKDLFIEENLIVLKLLLNGATYKNLDGGKEYFWTGIKALTAYIELKKDEAIDLAKMNRHSKACTNRHVKCLHGGKVQSNDI